MEDSSLLTRQITEEKAQLFFGGEQHNRIFIGFLDKNAKDFYETVGNDPESFSKTPFFRSLCFYAIQEYQQKKQITDLAQLWEDYTQEQHWQQQNEQRAVFNFQQELKRLADALQAINILDTRRVQEQWGSAVELIKNKIKFITKVMEKLLSDLLLSFLNYLQTKSLFFNKPWELDLADFQFDYVDGKRSVYLDAVKQYWIGVLQNHLEQHAYFPFVALTLEMNDFTSLKELMELLNQHYPYFEELNVIVNHHHFGEAELDEVQSFFCNKKICFRLRIIEIQNDGALINPVLVRKPLETPSIIVLENISAQNRRERNAGIIQDHRESVQSIPLSPFACSTVVPYASSTKHPQKLAHGDKPRACLSDHFDFARHLTTEISHEVSVGQQQMVQQQMQSQLSQQQVVDQPIEVFSKCREPELWDRMRYLEESLGAGFVMPTERVGDVTQNREAEVNKFWHKLTGESTEYGALPHGIHYFTYAALRAIHHDPTAFPERLDIYELPLHFHLNTITQDGKRYNVIDYNPKIAPAAPKRDSVLAPTLRTAYKETSWYGNWHQFDKRFGERLDAYQDGLLYSWIREKDRKVCVSDTDWKSKFESINPRFVKRCEGKYSFFKKTPEPPRYAYFILFDLYFHAGEMAVETFLGVLEVLSKNNAPVYENFIHYFMELRLGWNHKEGWVPEMALDATLEFIDDNRLDLLASMANLSPAESMWWMKLVELQSKQPNLDFKQLYDGFQFFLGELKKLEVDLPSTCLIEKSDHVLAALENLLALLKLLTREERQRQMLYLQEVDLSVYGALTAVKHEGFRFCTKEMCLSLEAQILPRDRVNPQEIYRPYYQNFISISDKDLFLYKEKVRIFFFRFVGCAEQSNDYDIYIEIDSKIQEIQSNLIKTMLYGLLAVSSTGRGYLNACHSIDVINFVRAQEVHKSEAILRALANKLGRTRFFPTVDELYGLIEFLYACDEEMRGAIFLSDSLFSLEGFQVFATWHQNLRRIPVAFFYGAINERGDSVFRDLEAICPKSLLLKVIAKLDGTNSNDQKMKALADALDVYATQSAFKHRTSLLSLLAVLSTIDVSCSPLLTIDQLVGLIEEVKKEEVAPENLFAWVQQKYPMLIFSCADTFTKEKAQLQKFFIQFNEKWGAHFDVCQKCIQNSPRLQSWTEEKHIALLEYFFAFHTKTLPLSLFEIIWPQQESSHAFIDGYLEKLYQGFYRLISSQLNLRAMLAFSALWAAFEPDQLDVDVLASAVALAVKVQGLSESLFEIFLERCCAFLREKNNANDKIAGVDNVNVIISLFVDDDGIIESQYINLIQLALKSFSFERLKNCCAALSLIDEKHLDLKKHFLQMLVFSEVNDNFFENLANHLAKWPNSLMDLYQHPPYPNCQWLETYLQSEEDDKDRLIKAFRHDPWNKRTTKEIWDQQFAFSPELVMSRIDGIRDLVTERPLPYAKRQKLYEALSYVNSVGHTHPYAYQKPADQLTQEEMKELMGEIRNFLMDKEKLLRCSSDDIFKAQCDLLALMREVIYRTTGDFLNTTQITTILNKILHKTSCVSEVQTGEGKTYDVYVAAFLACCYGYPVNVCTASMALASRDLEGFNHIANYLGIPTSLIYAHTLGAYRYDGINFSSVDEMAIFEQQQRLENTSFLDQTCSILDEVDLYLLSHKVLLRLSACLEEGFDADQNIHAWVYPIILRFVDTESFRATNTIQAGVDALRHFVAEHTEIGKAFKESFMHFSDQQLDEWIDAAFIAKKLILMDEESFSVRTKKQYHYREMEEEKLAIVRVLSRLSEKSEFSDGVHQMLHTLLEEKEQQKSKSHTVHFPIKPQKSYLVVQSVKNFIDRHLRASDQAFAQGLVQGFTGTAGSFQERQEVYQKFSMGIFSIPAHEELTRLKLPLKVARKKWRESAEDAHKRMILRSVRAAQKKKQPVLIFCKTVKFAQNLGTFLEANGVLENHLNLYAVESEDLLKEKLVVQKAKEDKAVTVTTDMLGRGANIQPLHQEGLHTLITYVEEGVREERQMEGRSARTGAPRGSVEYIFSEAEFTDRNLPLPKDKKLPEVITDIRQQASMKAAHDRFYRELMTDLADQWLSQYIALRQFAKNHVEEVKGDIFPRQLHKIWSDFLKAFEYDWRREMHQFDLHSSEDKNFTDFLSRMNAIWRQTYQQMIQLVKEKAKLEIIDEFPASREVKPFAPLLKENFDAHENPRDVLALDPKRANPDWTWIHFAHVTREEFPGIYRQALMVELKNIGDGDYQEGMDLNTYFQCVFEAVLEKRAAYLSAACTLDDVFEYGDYQRLICAIKELGDDALKEQAKITYETHTKKIEQAIKNRRNRTPQLQSRYAQYLKHLLEERKRLFPEFPYKLSWEGLTEKIQEVLLAYRNCGWKSRDRRRHYGEFTAAYDAIKKGEQENSQKIASILALIKKHRALLIEGDKEVNRHRSWRSPRNIKGSRFHTMLTSIETHIASYQENQLETVRLALMDSLEQSKDFFSLDDHEKLIIDGLVEKLKNLEGGEYHMYAELSAFFVLKECHAKEKQKQLKGHENEVKRAEEKFWEAMQDRLTVISKGIDWKERSSLQKFYETLSGNLRYLTLTRPYDGKMILAEIERTVNHLFSQAEGYLFFVNKSATNEDGSLAIELLTFDEEAVVKKWVVTVSQESCFASFPVRGELNASACISHVKDAQLTPAKIQFFLQWCCKDMNAFVQYVKQQDEVDRTKIVRAILPRLPENFADDLSRCIFVSSDAPNQYLSLSKLFGDWSARKEKLNECIEHSSHRRVTC